jgi:hypothetical protein
VDAYDVFCLRFNPRYALLELRASFRQHCPLLLALPTSPASFAL